MVLSVQHFESLPLLRPLFPMTLLPVLLMLATMTLAASLPVVPMVHRQTAVLLEMSHSEQHLLFPWPPQTFLLVALFSALFLSVLQTMAPQMFPIVSQQKDVLETAPLASVQQQLSRIAPQKSHPILRQFLQFGHSDAHVLSLASHEQVLFWKKDKIQN